MAAVACAFAEAYDILALQVWLFHQNVDNALDGNTFGFSEVYDWEPSQLDNVEVETNPDFISAYQPGFNAEYEPFGGEDF